jgi:hypothetical protein
VFHIVAARPQGKYRTDRARELLRWQPRGGMDIHWRHCI